MEHLPSLLTIQGSRLVIVPAASSSQTGFGFGFDDGQHTSGGRQARAQILHNYLQTHQRFSNNGFQTTEESTEPKLFFGKLILLNLFSMP